MLIRIFIYYENNKFKLCNDKLKKNCYSSLALVRISLFYIYIR